ncbi:restriction endonuclease subunit S [Brachyspira hyodysenteriae]|uniref:restriction endonuclease subunit S n=1 Tax=Brachyspira hyodysenteriae TaxID=159 RepID=UPI00063DC568|nr:restriction endonuclease subunit S [Brachyspira hyodysenteriae]KLI53797.1 hypothetical protein SZ42_00120 [Brachyspira hyodysenteriae]
MKELKEDWQEVRLGDLGEIVTGNTPPTKNTEYFGNDYNFVTPSDYKNLNKYISHTERGISKLGENKFKNKMLPPNSIMVTCIGSDMGRILINKNRVLTNQQINSIIVNPDKYFYDFIYYMLVNNSSIIKASVSGTAVPILNKSDFSNLEFKIPNLEKQKKIASILSSLDDKIELNNRMNKILEETAQTIFKEWFINFNFPNEEGKPYKKSGGKMIESELGEIPEGWEVGIIKDISKEVICGKTPPTKDDKNYGNYMPFITIPDMHNNTYIIKTERYLSDKGVNTQVNKTIPENSICVSCIATVGLVSLTSKKSQTNQQINSIIPKDNISSYWVYFYMKNISNIIINYASGGTTTLNLNKSLFEKINIIIPEISLLIKFNNSVKSIFDTIKLNQIENQKLAGIRDSILPKLMSGEIRIK